MKNKGQSESLPTLKQVAHMQSDAMLDVRALLAVARLLTTGGGKLDRIIRVAQKRLEKVHRAFQPYI